MTNQELIDFFKKSHRDLMNAVKYINQTSLQEWKDNLLPKLEGSSKVKISRLELIDSANSYTEPYIKDHELKISETILRDSFFKYTSQKTKENLEALKILKAREENIDFELELAEMVCGDKENFPYRSSKYLTEFFQNLGHNFIHEGEIRRTWVKEKLEELNVKEIHTLISTGLFKKKYFTDYNNDQRNKKILFTEAAKTFNVFMKNSLTANEVFDLSGVLNMNVNIELLFDQKADTEDIELNKLIEEARNRFLNNDKQVGLEKLWAAFGRLRTLFAKDKKENAEVLIPLISNDFDAEVINEEFLKLGKIGNTYRIRHHETWAFDLTPEHTNYFFFRMLSLIDLCLVFLNKQGQEGNNLF